MMDSITRRHDLERYGALSRMMNAWATRAHRNAVAAWLRAAVGDTGQVHGLDGITRNYTITARGIGYAVATFDDGSTQTVYAPAPVA